MSDQATLKGWTIIPTPQTMQHKANIALLPMCGRINEARAVGDDRHILAVQLIDDIRAATGLEWDIATGDRWPGFITLTTFDEPHAHPSGAYTLDVTPDGVTVAGADFEGVRNGVQTLRQLIRQCGAALPCLHIEDRPTFETRGYYLDVTRLCRHLEARGRRPMMWGDIALEHPEILDRLPETVTLLNWQYDPQVTDEKIRTVAQSGATQIVCPAVWCWNALLPRIDDAWNNITRMARYGAQYHAQGMLITDWGDFGHVNDPRMDIPGMIIGAQESWNPRRIPDEADMLRRISRLEYHDASGELLDILARASHAASFEWNHLITWLELDDGQGGVNTGVLQTIPGLLPENERPDDAIRTLRDESKTPSLAESRRMLLRYLEHHIVLGETADHLLQASARRISAITATAGPRNAGNAAAFRIAIEGQRLLNRVGLQLASETGITDTLQPNTTSQHNDEANLAEALEIWMEAYAAQWSTVSRDSELRRLQDTVRELTDYLRFQSV